MERPYIVYLNGGNLHLYDPLSDDPERVLGGISFSYIGGYVVPSPILDYKELKAEVGVMRIRDREKMYEYTVILPVDERIIVRDGDRDVVATPDDLAGKMVPRVPRNLVESMRGKNDIEVSLFLENIYEPEFLTVEYYERKGYIDAKIPLTDSYTYVLNNLIMIRLYPSIGKLTDTEG